jgi:hypothetical protein
MPSPLLRLTNMIMEPAHAQNASAAACARHGARHGAVVAARAPAQTLPPCHSQGADLHKLAASQGVQLRDVYIVGCGAGLRMTGVRLPWPCTRPLKYTPAAPTYKLRIVTLSGQLSTVLVVAIPQIDATESRQSTQSRVWAAC